MAAKRQTGQASPAPGGDPGAGAPVTVRVRLLETIERGGETVAAGSVITVAERRARIWCEGGMAELVE